MSRKALRGDLALPDFPGFCEKLTDIFQEVAANKGGEVAAYIPELAKVPFDKFGLAVCSIDGQKFSLGDAEEYFSLQSISKTVSYCLALEEFGEDVVHAHVGREPSGGSFNAITLDAQNRPHNPMINAGAIMSCSLIKPSEKLAQRFAYVLSVWEKLAGTIKPIFNNTLYLSEKQTADRNFALAYFMSEKKKFPKNTNLFETLDLYFQCCSIELTCQGMAVVAATLANGGVNPCSGERIFQVSTVKNCLSLMYSCGMYDFSGEFAFTIGLPAKSGVGGGLMIVVPNVLGICVWAPPVDRIGNSVKGVLVCRELVRHFNFHIYDSLLAGGQRKPDISLLCWAAVQGDIAEMRRLLAAAIDPNGADYDGRTPLHVAASEGHYDAVALLLEHGCVSQAKDRWGNTALDDAVRGGKKSIIDILSKVTR